MTPALPRQPDAPRTRSQSGVRLRRIYRTLLRALGPQGWWPGCTRFEVILGAILTLNTAWVNVARAHANLRRGEGLTPTGLAALPRSRLAALIRPAGYYNTKAARLRSFLDFLVSADL